MSSSSRLYLIRHGEGENNIRTNIIGGRSNELGLTGNGIDQSKKLGRAFLAAGITPDLVIASPAVRAMQTAQTTLAEMKFDIPISEDESLQEQDTGEWTGQVATDIFTKDTLDLISNLGNDFRSPGGESFSDVGTRMLDRMESLPNVPTTFAFTHGGAIRCLIGRMYGWTHDEIYAIKPANASVTRLSKADKDWHLDYLAKSAEEIGAGDE